MNLLLILYKIVNKLLIILEEVYKNFYYKKYMIEKFKELKISLRFFNIFYSEFIKLVAEPKFIIEILL